jgi:hypothetical protein
MPSVENEEGQVMPTGGEPRHRQRRLLLIAVAGIVAGIGIVIRLVDSWGAGAPSDQPSCAAQ